MALLQNDEFATWYMRTAYLASVKDGIGERLINVNSSILNTPGFRAAGWTTNSAELKRAHSPPIPTSVRSDYFRVPVAGLRRAETWPEEDDDGGAVTGRRSNDTIGPAPATKRRRKREQMEEEDSSDLSDESDDEPDSNQRAARQIKFTPMPVRSRADSSPIRKTEARPGPEVLVTSPSRRSADRLRRGSLGAVEAIKARARADTATSSEMSSENEGLDPSLFARRRINSRTTSFGTAAGARNTSKETNSPISGGAENDQSDVDSVNSTLSSEFGEVLPSGSLLDTVEVPGLDSSSPMLSHLNPVDNASSEKPKHEPLPIIQDFPARPRPISMAPPVSLLGLALRARKSKPVNMVETFSSLSGKGITDPLWIKIYAPFSDDPETPYEMPLVRQSNDGLLTTVAEAIGLSLYRYSEEKFKPQLELEKLNANKWTLRMIEDGEVDFDFPALSRTKPITDFTSNNNRGARGRSREKPWDEFALVEATKEQAEENDKVTPQEQPASSALEEPTESIDPSDPNAQTSLPRQNITGARNRGVIATPFSSALPNKARRPADEPEPNLPSATPRIGTMKTLRISHYDLDITQASTTTLTISTDSYMAEILDQVCKQWNLDKAAYILKVHNTVTIAPLDRTVEALGPRTELDLVRRRFGPGPLSLTGSPDSASPNAPLLIDIEGAKKASKKSQAAGNTGLFSAGGAYHHPLSQKSDLLSSLANYKKYNVTRKHLTAFSQASHKRVLSLDADYMHIMPGEEAGGRMIGGLGGYAAGLGGGQAKTVSIPFADIRATKVSGRHPKVFRVIVKRPGTGGGEKADVKRYDFEARGDGEAKEIVEEIRKVMIPE